MLHLIGNRIATLQSLYELGTDLLKLPKIIVKLHMSSAIST